MIPLLSGILITLFGGLTIYFDDPIFIYMKPTIINVLFGLALLFGKYFTKVPVLKKILGKSIYLIILISIIEIYNRDIYNRDTISRDKSIEKEKENN